MNKPFPPDSLRFKEKVKKNDPEEEDMTTKMLDRLRTFLIEQNIACTEA